MSRCSKTKKQCPHWSSKQILWELDPFLMQKNFFCSDNFASIMATWVNTLYFCNTRTAAVQKHKIKIRLPRFIINTSYQPNFMTFHRSLKEPADVDSWQLIIIIIIITIMMIIIIFIQGAHSPWQFSVGHTLVATTITERWYTSLN